MPSAHYYREQAKTLLSWAGATTDQSCATVLRKQAAKELRQADAARETVRDLNVLLIEFNDRQMRS